MGGQTDKRTDGQINGRTKVPLSSTGLRPLWGRCPKELDFRPERVDFRPDRADFKPDRADFRPERARGRQMDRWDK